MRRKRESQHRVTGCDAITAKRLGGADLPFEIDCENIGGKRIDS